MTENSTVAAISTPPAAGGIAVVRVSGPNAVAVASGVFRPAHGRLCEMAGYTAAYGRFFDGDGVFDDGVALIFRAPHSYTGEDVAELSCHGGVYIARRLLAAVIAAGGSPAGPGEFTKRAFLNGKMTLTEAESVMAKISAEGRAALAEAEEAAGGRTAAAASAIKEKLLSAAAELAAYLEYPDDDIEPPTDIPARLEAAAADVSAILARYERGAVRRGGLNTVIAGRPNVGKSALMNLLAGCERSIVTPIAGTTRDAVEETVSLDGLLLRLSDTAGIRGGGGQIEEMGMEITRRRVAAAQLVLAVFDGSEPLSQSDREVIELCRGVSTVAVINKSDLPQVLKKADLEPYFSHIAVISATGSGDVSELAAAISAELGAQNAEPSPIFNDRQRDCLLRVRARLLSVAADCRAGLTPDAASVGIENALSELCALTGENASDEIIDEVFKKFCIGK